MTKILRVKAFGFAPLADGNELDFASKERKPGKAGKEVAKITEGLYCPKALGLKGPKAERDGAIRLLVLVSSLLTSGYFRARPSEFVGERITLEIDFYKRGKIFFFKGSFFRDEYLLKSQPAMLKGEELKCRAWNKPEESPKTIMSFPYTNPFSVINEYTYGFHYSFFAPEKAINKATGGMHFVRALLDASPADLIEAARLTDPAISVLSVREDDRYEFAYEGEPTKVLNPKGLIAFLGEKKAIALTLYLKALEILSIGGILLLRGLDDPRLSKEAADKVLELFKDGHHNRHKAQLIFTAEPVGSSSL